MTNEKTVAILLMAFSALVIIWGFITATEVTRDKSGSDIIDAKITRMEERYTTGAKKKRVYIPHIDYTYNGKEYKDIECLTGDRQLGVGSEIKIYIKRNNPLKVRYIYNTGSSGAGCLMVVLGVIVAVPGYMLYKKE